MLQAFSRRPVTVKVPVHSQPSPCEIHVGHSGTGTVFFPRVLSFCAVIIFPPTLHIHLGVNIALDSDKHEKSGEPS